MAVDPQKSAPAAAVLTTPEPTRYRIGPEIGRGGLGCVVEAADQRLGRVVAIKRLHRTSGTARVRFVREVELTAQLEHPGIVPIYDAGIDDEGAPYYAMRRYTGETLAARVDAATTPEARLALVPHVLAAAEAVAFAHDRGVVHRDLKPANVLVGELGETVVIDWGLARRVDDVEADARSATDARPSGDQPVDVTRTSSDDDGATAVPPAPSDERLTRAGDVVGTPAFMAPEQGAGASVGPPADVYALGATLYYVLAGVLPFTGSAHEVQVARATRDPDPVDARAPVPPELAAIVRHAMARAPEQRYPTARELAADLRRFLTGRLVGAHEYGAWALVRRWIRRHRATVAVAVIAALALAVVGAISVVRIRRERDLASDRANRLRLLQARAELDRDPTTAAAWLSRYRIEPDQLGEVVRIASAAAPEVATDVLRVPGDSALQVCASPDGRYVVGLGRRGETHWWDRQRRETAVIGSLAESPLVCRVAANGRTAVLLGRRGNAAWIELATGAWHKLPVAPVLRTVFAGDRLVVVDPKQNVYLVDQPGAAPRPLGATPTRIGWVTPAPDGRQIAVGGIDGSVWAWPLDGAPRPLARHDGTITSLGFGADGILVTASRDAVKLHDLAGGVRSLALDAAADTFVLASPIPGGALIVDSDAPHRVRLWRGTGDAETIAIDAYYESMTTSADGAVAAWASVDGVIRVLDTRSGAIRRLRGHATGVRDLRLTPDGRTLISTAADGTVRVWQPAPPEGRALAGAAGPITWLTASPDRDLVLAGDETGQVTRWDATGARALGRIGAPVVRVLLSRDATRAVAGGKNDELTVWDLATGAAQPLAGTAGGALPIGFTATGEVIALCDDDRYRIWDRAGQARELAAKGTYSASHLLGGAAAVASSTFMGLELLPIDGRAPRKLRGPTGPSFTLDSSRDGRHLIAGTGAGQVWAWDLAAGDDGRLLGQLRGTVLDTAVSPDGRLAAACDETGAIGIWPLAGGEPRWLRADGRIEYLVFTPSGHLLSEGHGLLRLWDPATGASAVVGDHGRAVRRVSAGGDRVITAADDGPPRLWHLAGASLAPADADALTRWVAGLTRARIDEGSGGAATAITERRAR